VGASGVADLASVLDRAGFEEGQRGAVPGAWCSPAPGWGLSLSYGIVLPHGGRIEVRCERGKGSVFRAVLP